MKQFTQISLQDLHTFHTNSVATLLTIFYSVKEAAEYLKKTPVHTNRMVIGEGSNLLFTENFSGELLKIENKGFQVVEEKGAHVWVEAAAGESWDDFVAWTVEQGYGGIENLSYIPGTVGAAPVQNIGAYGVEFKDVFQSLKAINLQQGEIGNFYLQELNFDYRYSIFKGSLKNQYLITSVIVKLDRYHKLKLDYGQLENEAKAISTKSYPDISDVRKAVIKIRRSKLPEPKETGNAGSFFKNPVIENHSFEALQKKYPQIAHYPLEDGRVKLAAAWLIEQAGLKNFSMGQAATHSNHALIIINKGKANGQELHELALHIQKVVDEKFKVKLEPEVLIL